MSKYINNTERYNSIDGLRAISCFAIIAMHIKENTNYAISGFFYNNFIPSLTMLVYLFLMISSFGMCCGYYDKFHDKKIDIEQFYLKRYKKILPFFSLLILFNLIIEPNLNNIYEAFIEMTLMFGFLPNNELSVIGVSWTIGVIFVFYFIFPFFTFLIANKRRSIITFLISIIMNYLCSIYFFSEKFVLSNFSFRHSFIYCFPYFLAGGVLYKYKKNIVEYVNKHRIISFISCLLFTSLYFLIPDNIGTINIFTIKLLIIFMAWLAYSISINSKFLTNRYMKYFSNISMEMYLAQMVVFRGIEKIGLLYVFGRGWVSYILTILLVILGLIVFIEIYKKIVYLINIQVNRLKKSNIIN